MKETTKKYGPTRPTRAAARRSHADLHGGRLIVLERNVWRVFCLRGNNVAGSCGHAHQTLTNAMRCSYQPVAYRHDPAAELRVRQVKAARPR